MRRQGVRFLITLSLIGLAGGLLAWTFTHIRWQEVWGALRSLHGWQLAFLFVLNLCIVALFSARWWFLLRLQGFKVPFLTLAVYRLAGFGVSYLTPGPQFGGEGWLVVLLRRRHAVALAEGSVSVAVDRLIELLANFTFLTFGLLVSVWVGISHPILSVAFAMPLIALLTVPFNLFAMLAKGLLPANWLLKRWQHPPLGVKGFLNFIADAEQRSAHLMRHNLGKLIVLYFYSVVIWVAMVGEYWLTLRFLALETNFQQTLFAMTATRLAFLPPLPGGVGALEAAQVAAFQVLGITASAGLSLSLLQRSRDLVLASLGIVLGSVLHLRSANKPPSLEAPSPYPSLTLQERE